MSKKTLIIVLVFLLLALGTAGVYLYKKGYFTAKPSEPELPSMEKLLTLDVKNPNLTPEVAALYEEKFSILKERLQKDPNAYRDWISLGIVKKGVDDFEGARDIWLYAKELDPADSLAYGNLGDLYANFLSEPEKGEQYYKKALELDPRDINYYLGLADVYRYRLPGKEALYEQTILNALEILPDNPNLIAPLASYYRQTNQTEKAIQYYEKLIELVPDNQAAKEELEELKKRK